MAVIGWLALVVLLAGLTLGWALFALNGLGKFNIGGVPNKASQKLLLLILGALVGYAWYWLWISAPFKVTLTQ